MWIYCYRASLRFAYQDLSVERKKQEAQLHNMNPMKAEQMQRLGMGMTGGRLVSIFALPYISSFEWKVLWYHYQGTICNNLETIFQ